MHRAPEVVRRHYITWSDVSWILFYKVRDKVATFTFPSAGHPSGSGTLPVSIQIRPVGTSRKLILNAWLEFRPVTWSSIFVQFSSKRSMARWWPVDQSEQELWVPVQNSRASLSRWFPCSSCTRLCGYVLVCFPPKFKSSFLFPALHPCK